MVEDEQAVYTDPDGKVWHPHRGYWCWKVSSELAQAQERIKELEAQLAATKEGLGKIAGSHWERIGYCQTDNEDVPDLSGEEAMLLSRRILSTLEATPPAPKDPWPVHYANTTAPGRFAPPAPKVTEAQAEVVAKLITRWLGRSWEGLPEGRVTEKGFPVFSHSQRGWGFNGRKGDMIDLAREALSAAQEAAPKVTDGEWREVQTAHLLKGRRRSPAYFPSTGEVCEVSGPNCDNADGYTWGETTVLWQNEIFVLYGSEGFWPVLHKHEHVLFRPLTAAQEAGKP